MKIESDKLFDELLHEDQETADIDIAQVIEEKIVSSLEKFKDDFDKKLDAIAQRTEATSEDDIDDVNEDNTDVNDESEVNEDDEL